MPSDLPLRAARLQPIVPGSKKGRRMSMPASGFTLEKIVRRASFADQKKAGLPEIDNSGPLVTDLVASIKSKKPRRKSMSFSPQLLSRLHGEMGGRKTMCELTNR